MHSLYSSQHALVSYSIQRRTSSVPLTPQIRAHVSDIVKSWITDLLTHDSEGAYLGIMTPSGFRPVQWLLCIMTPARPRQLLHSWRDLGGFHGTGHWRQIYVLNRPGICDSRYKKWGENLRLPANAGCGEHITSTRFTQTWSHKSQVCT